MAADLSRLPIFLKDLVVEKMKLEEMLSFGQSSKVAYSVLKRFSIPDEVSKVEINLFKGEINVRFMPAHFQKGVKWHKASDLPAIKFVDQTVVIKDMLDDSYCEKLCAFFRRMGAKNSKLGVGAQYSSIYAWKCSPTAFHELLKAADVTELCRTVGECPPYLLCNLPEQIRKVEVNSPVKDNDLQMINMTNMEIHDADVGPRGLSALLKEWFEGKRQIKKFLLNNKHPFLAEHILYGLDFERTAYSDLFVLNNGQQRLFCSIDEIGQFGLSKRMADLSYGSMSYL